MRRANNTPAIRWKPWGQWIAVVVSLLLLALLLAWISSEYRSTQGWLSFLVMELIATGILLATWWGVSKGEERPLPKTLAYLVVFAAALRLALGAIWFVSLPVLGHDSPPELGGYVLADAFHRDRAAWELAQSGKPLWSAFGSQRAIDQYGGMLFTSGLIYRYLGGPSHQPLQVVVLTAAISSLAVLFTFSFARRAWNSKVAWIAAGGLSLFPDAVLMGSSQMREAITITLVMMAFYGLINYEQERTRNGLFWMIAAILLFLPLSPPFTALLVLMLAATAVFGLKMARWRIRSTTGSPNQRHTWILVAVVIVLVLAGVWWALGQFTPEDITNPVERLNWWIRKSAFLQSYLSERASGKIQAIFDRTPEWAHTPLLLGYGIVQPLLPAALIATSEAPIWHGLAIFRALGWTILLIMLIYGTWRAWRVESPAITRVLTVLVWVVFLVASFRGGGDQWDNPRYRVPFLGLQAALAAWAWVEQRQSKDRVFRYILVWITVTVLWFVPWYLYRKLSIMWPVEDIFKTLGLAAATTVLLILFDLARMPKPED